MADYASVAREIEENLKKDKWQVKKIDGLPQAAGGLLAKKKFFLFFPRIYIYVLMPEVTAEKMLQVKKLLLEKEQKVHGIWFLSDNIPQEATSLAKKHRLLGLIRLRLEQEEDKWPK